MMVVVEEEYYQEYLVYVQLLSRVFLVKDLDRLLEMLQTLFSGCYYFFQV